MKIQLFSEIVEENGNTIRENNMEKKHNIPLGSIVEVEMVYDVSIGDITQSLKGTIKLYVVSHGRDCDGTPLYIIGDIPVAYPNVKTFSQEWMQYKAFCKISDHGYPEESLKQTGKVVELKKNFEEFFYE